MASKVRTSTPPGTMQPIGPYSHISQVGEFVTVGAIAGVDPATGKLVEGGIAAETRQIIDAFEIMLGSVGSDLDHILHINVFLADMAEFEAMNAAYAARMGARRPPRTAIAVAGLPKQGARLTMNLTAVARN